LRRDLALGIQPALLSQIRVLTQLLATIERGDLGPISYVTRNEIRRVLGRTPTDKSHD
jgi:hypothetical protein